MPTVPHARRLGDVLRPEHYDIALQVDPSWPHFDGHVVLQAELAHGVDELVMHGRDLQVHEALVQQGADTQRCVVGIEQADECIVLRPETKRRPHAFAAGKIRIALRYRGRLAQSMHGLYLAKDGPEIALVSQCEASDARSILPCLDEPAHKASFAWTVQCPSGLQAIANGRLLKSRQQKGISTHTFEKTAKMSTYLLALTVGAFDAGPQKRVLGVPCRIWAGRGKARQTPFALAVTQKVLPWYTKYFQAPYAFGKLDQVAVPGFDAGAMENSGAIFYRQSLLLLEPKLASRAAQKRIAEVIAHEIAHQWFGNLVTMKWWDDLWLNEAFATWIAFKVSDVLQPKWEIWLDYLEAKEAALAADALPSTHPIWAPVHHPAQATELFDVITYEKGCGVLRMAERYLGEGRFRSGIRRYIRQYRFGNAEGRDLWRHLAQASGEPIAEVMSAWVKQKGFPLIDCAMVQKRGQSVLRFRQQRFCENTPAQSRTPKALWPTPIVVRYPAGKTIRTARFLLQGESGEFVLPSLGGRPAPWAWANADASGFYRVRMERSLDAAVLQAAPRHLATADRMALLNDKWALMRAGYGGIDEVMQALVALAGDRHPSVSRVVVSRLRAIANHLLAPADRPMFRRLCDALFSPALKAMRPANLRSGRSAEQGVRLATLLEAVGGLARHPKLLAHLRRAQQQEAHRPDALDANLAGSVVALAALEQPVAYYRSLLREYLARKHKGLAPELCGRYLGALCMAESGEPLAFVLAACLSGDIPQEQLRTVVATLLMRRQSGPQVWRWLCAHWTRIAPKVGAMGMARLVEATGALPPAMQPQVQRFFAKHPVPEAHRAVQKSAEAMQLWQRVGHAQGPALHAWLCAWAQTRTQTDALVSTSAKKRARK